MKSKEAFQLLLQLFVSIVLLVYLVDTIDLTKIWQTILSSNYPYLFLAAIFSVFASLLLPAKNIQVILSRYNLRYWTIFRIWSGVYPLQKIIPLKLGQILMPYSLRKYGVDFRSGFKALCVKLMLDVFSLFALLFISLSFYFPWLFFIFVVFLLFYFFFNRIFDKMVNLMKKIKFIRFLFEFPLEKRVSFIIYSLLSFLFIIIEAFFISASLNLQIPFYVILLNLPIVIFMSALPFSLAGVGVREISIITLFQVFAPKTALLAFGLLFGFIDVIVPCLIGLGLRLQK